MSEYLGSADEITIECDERGFELRISTDQGCYRINVHNAASDLYEAVQRTIAPWWAGGQAVLASMHRGPRGDCRWTNEDIAEYERQALLTFDPKHPDFHSIHADIWDNREKTP